MDICDCLVHFASEMVTNNDSSMIEDFQLSRIVKPVHFVKKEISEESVFNLKFKPYFAS